MNSKRILQIGLVTFLVLALLFVAGALVVRSRAFHQRLLAIIIERAQKSIGGQVEIGDLTFRFAGLRADLYRIAIHGTDPDPQKPLLWADHLAVSLRLISLWRREINLQEIVVDHPVVHLSVDARGHNNLPATPPSPPGSKPTAIFDLAIRHFVLNQGEIYYNDRQTPMEAEVRDLHTQVSFDASKPEYDGTLSYHQGRVRYGEYDALEHELEANFVAAPSGLTLNSLRLTTGSSRITAQAHLQDYSNPTVDGSYDALLSTDELRKLLRNNSLPVGEVSTRGAVHYRSNAGQPLINSLTVQGQLRSPALAVELPQARASVQTLRAEYRLDQGDLEVRQMQADVLGGHLTAQLSMKHLAATPEVHVMGKVSGLSFAEVSTALRAKPPLRLAGSLDGTVDAGWRGSMEGLQVRSDATLAASTAVPKATSSSSATPGCPDVIPAKAGIHYLSNSFPKAGRMDSRFRGNDVSTGKSACATQELPVNGVVHLTYTEPSGVLTSRQTSLHTPHTTLSLDGAVGKRSSLGIQAQSDDLGEIDVLLLAVRTATASQASSPPEPPQLLGLRGSASFNGQVLGTMKHFRVTGHMSGTDLRYQSTRLSALKTNVDVSSSGIALHQGELETSAQGRVKFDAAVGLSNWSYTPQSPINLRATADHLPVADVQRLAGLEYPVTGNLSVNVSLQGSQTNPAGQGSVRLVQARAWEQPIQDLSIQFQAADNTLHSTLNLHTPAGSGSVKMTYSMKDQAYDAQVDLPGIHLDQLQPVQARNLELTGVVKVSAQGRGTVKEPQLEATVEAPNLQIRQQKLDGLKIQASISRQRATFSVDSNVVGAYVQARGTVNLDSDYTANVNIDTRAIELGPLLATYLSVGPDVRGQTELHGWLKGPLKRPEKLEAHVEIPRLNLGYQSVQIANVTPLQIDYRGGTLALNRAELKGAGTDLQIEATVPVVSGGSLTATATGNVDLHILQVMNPQFESSGSIKLDVGAQGTRNHPDIHGQVRVIDAAFQAPGAPLGAEKVNAEFDFQGGRINISNFTAQSGGGTVTAQGFATYQPSVGFQVMLSARHVRLRYPEGVREVLDSDLTLNGTTESAALNGQVLIDGLSFTPSFNLSTFADQFSGTSSPPGAGFAQNVNLNVALKSAQEMSLASSQLSVQGSANLVVRGTLAEPVLLGRTQITGGELFFNNLRFQVDHGTIQFANPVSTEAVLNILVTTSAGGFNISVNLVGPLDRLRTTYTSDPPLAQVDIISLLFTGQTTEAAAANPSTPQSVLAGQMAGQVSSRLGKMAGISSLTIDPQIGGNQSNPGGSIGIQQRVTKNLFFTFTIDLTNTQGEVVQVEYQITPKYAVSAVATQNAGYSLEVKMHKKF